VIPAARRNPRRVSWDDVRPVPSVTVSGMGSAGTTVVGSTGTDTPVRGRMDGGMVAAGTLSRVGTNGPLWRVRANPVCGPRLLGCRG
jgi:hypothetical protein